MDAILSASKLHTDDSNDLLSLSSEEDDDNSTS